MSGITRREVMKQSLKATAYAAPAVISMSPAPRAAAVSGCHTTFTVTPGSSSSIAYGPVLQGTGFTPNGTISFSQISGFIGQCRGVVIIPGTTRTADALGNFNLTLPSTALNFSVVGAGVFPLVVSDDATGCTNTFNYTITAPTAAPADSLTLRYVSSPVSSPVTPGNVPGETGAGTAIVGQCFSVQNNPPSQLPSGFVELRLTLSGATPNRTFTFFITGAAAPTPGPNNLGTVTTDATGAVTIGRYLPGCVGKLSASSVLSLTTDGNAPGANNVAYKTSIAVNAIPPC